MSDDTAANPDSEPLAAPHTGALDLAQSVEIERTHGTITAKVQHFPALSGWEIRRQYREYLESKDPKFRMQFTMTVLSYATVVLPNDGGLTEVHMHSADDVNTYLESWQNVEKVFNAMLGYNGIKTDLAEIERGRWQVAGEDMASSFLAAVSSMIGPALALAGTPKAQAEG